MNNTSPHTLWFPLLAAVACVAASPTYGQTVSAALRHGLDQTIAGTIRIWGDENMSTVMRSWEEGFQRNHPGINFETRLIGTAAAMPALYTGLADLAVMGRESNATDDNGFLHVLYYLPLRLDLMTGSLDELGKSHALAIFVHRDNPTSRMTMAQLEAIFGCEHRRGVENIRTWGQLGLTGEWKDKPIHLYAYDAETGTGQFFLRKALADSRKMNWEYLTEFRDIKNSDGSIRESGQQILDALRKDRFGLAVSCMRYATPAVRPIALAMEDRGPYYLATKENLIARKYPLTRLTYAFLNRPPGKPTDPKVKEFLRYIFSREGREDVLRDGGYLPLSEEAIAEQLKKLD
jgi:phosphate transport system substrate-binding protein